MKKTLKPKKWTSLKEQNRISLLCLSLLIGFMMKSQAVHGQTVSTSKRVSYTSEQSHLFLAYPKKENVTINSSASFIIGSINPGTKLTINNVPVRQNKSGYFAHVIKLKRGTNSFTIRTAEGTGTVLKKLTISRPKLQASISSKSWQLKCLSPVKSQGLTAGDLLILKAKATPGSNVSVFLKNKVVHLSPASIVRKARSKRSRQQARMKSRKAGPKPSVNWGQAVAYGKVFQSLPYRSHDLYVGFYKIQPEDKFNNLKPKFRLKKGSKVLWRTAKAEISVVKQPILAQTIVRGAVARVAPGKARLTPLDKGVRLMVDGWKGKNFRCLYGRNKHVWLQSKEIAFEQSYPGFSGPPPRSLVKTVNLNRSIYGDALVIPLQQALPYEISQSMKPNKLTLRIYGATADTDWVSQQYRKAFEDGAAPKLSNDIGKPFNQKANEVPGFNQGLVESINWKQVSDDVYELTINLRGHRQWGHTVAYDRTNLLVHIKDAPRLTQGVNGTKQLNGLKICIDPGHGGTQPGAMGCSGVSEAALNLAISLKLKKALQHVGATVFITRTTDKTLGLYDRVNIARAQNADILLSVHNNSLPDGRDPWKEHGTSTYFYNSQARELARVLDKSLVNSLKFPNIGARYQNLALTRPTQMLAVLVEIGFMIHPDEYAHLLQEKNQKKAADAIVSGLIQYLKVSK